VNLLSQPYILYPLVGILAFFVVYFQIERGITWIKGKAFTQREVIFDYLDKMFVDIDRDRAEKLLYLVAFGLGAVGFILAWPNVIGALIAGTALTFIGWNAPRVILESMWKSRVKKIVAQMVDGLTIMGNGIKAGLSVQQSLERVVENLGGAIGQEFSLVLSQVRIGRTLEEALTEFADRIPEPEVQMFVTSIVILKETGGNLAETFATTVITIRDRQKVEKKIQAMTAQGIMQGIIITSIPFVLLGVFFAIDPTFIMPMFTSTLGIIFLLIVLALQITGGLMIRKIVDIKV
jgi:tight adherence protein B